MKRHKKNLGSGKFNFCLFAKRIISLSFFDFPWLNNHLLNNWLSREIVRSLLRCRAVSQAISILSTRQYPPFAKFAAYLSHPICKYNKQKNHGWPCTCYWPRCSGPVFLHLVSSVFIQRASPIHVSYFYMRAANAYRFFCIFVNDFN